MERIRETQWRIWSTDLCGWDEDEIRRHRTNRQFRSNPVSTCACTEASRRPSWPSYHSPIAHRWSPSQLEHTAPRCAVMSPPLVCARICLPIYPQNWKKISISPKLVSDICQLYMWKSITNIQFDIEIIEEGGGCWWQPSYLPIPGQPDMSTDWTLTHV